MADLLDHVSDVESNIVEKRIQAIRNQGRELQPKGECYNCAEPLVGQQLFCDHDCSDDYKRLNK